MRLADQKALSLEKAVLMALVYADLFAYPLTADEVWFWLPREATRKETNKTLKRLLEIKKIRKQSSFYFLADPGVILARGRKEACSGKKLDLARKVSQGIARCPWVELVAVSGNLAIRAASSSDDVDLFIIALPGCLYRARLASVLITEAFGRRRRPGEREAADKICLNLFLEGDNLVLPKSRQDFYTAHEALQLLPLAGNMGFYRQFLLDNKWLAGYLPQAYRVRLKGLPVENIALASKRGGANWLERVAEVSQLFYSRCRRRQLVTNENNKRQLFFHPQDQRWKILARFNKGLRKIAS